MTFSVIRLGLGLLTLIAVNIILGSVDALLTGVFDKRKFWRGVCKGIIVSLCFVATYLVGWLNPDVLAVTIGDQSVNLLTAVYMVIMAGFLYYAQEVVRKLATFVSGSLNVVWLNPDDFSAIDNAEPIQVPPYSPGGTVSHGASDKQKT